MRAYTIPLSPEPQSFGITLAGREYRLTVRWFAAPEAGWTLDIEEPDKAAPIIMGLPLVTGCDLLEPFAYMEFGGELWIDSEMPATFDNLGAGVDLAFLVEDDA
jgi:hypothetical protein